MEMKIWEREVEIYEYLLILWAVFILKKKNLTAGRVYNRKLWYCLTSQKEWLKLSCFPLMIYQSREINTIKLTTMVERCLLATHFWKIPAHPSDLSPNVFTLSCTELLPWSASTFWDYSHLHIGLNYLRYLSLLSTLGFWELRL